MSLSRKRKKELRKLQEQASKLWESQQVLLNESAHVAQEAGRQISHFGREQVVPTVQQSYGKYAAPYVGRTVEASKHLLSDKVVPTAGALVGSALSIWDAAGETRSKLASGRGFSLPDAKAYSKKADKYSKQATKALSKKLAVAPKNDGIGAGGVFAIILGAAAAIGVAYAAWQTLRADDELWVADDPLRAPDA
ncbi:MULTISPECIES: DNA helicase [unclassified Microbacterium]|uniref:DNA helicase n=1 Tax=unclassified Microbacterium TaxID=2609290 RepID=UPI0037459AA1